MRRRPKTRIILLLLAAALLLVTGIFLAVASRLRPENVRRECLARLAELFPRSRPSIQIGFAELSLGDGLLLRDVSLRSAGEAATEVLRADHIRVDVDSAALTTGSFQPRAVEIHGLLLNLVRQADGTWVHDALLRDLRETTRREPAGPLPNIHLRNGRIRYRDGALSSEAAPLELELGSMEATVTPVARGDELVPRFSVRGKGTLVRSLSVFGHWDMGANQLAIEQLAAEVDLSRERREEIPGLLRDLLDRGKLEGRVEVVGRLNVSARGETSGVELAATVVRGGAVIPGTDFRIDSVSAVVHYDGHRLEVERFKALTPAGSCDAGGTLELRPGEDGEIRPGPAHLAVNFPMVHFREDLLGTLPDSFTAELRANQIQGLAAVSVGVNCERWPPRFREWTASVAPRGLSFRYKRFPYPLEILDGKVTFSGGKVVIDPPWRGRAGTARVEGTGFMDLEPSDEPSRNVRVREGELRIRVEGVTVTPEIPAALNEKARKIWEDYDPVGKGDVDVRTDWSPQSSRPRTVISVSPRSAKFRYRRFPVTVDHVQGKVIVDLLDRTVKIVNATGRHRHRLLAGSGMVHYGEEKRSFNIDISCESLSLTRELLAALPEDVQSPLEENRISGQARVHVNVNRKPGADRTVIRVETHLGNLVIHPQQFPFPFVLDGGRIEFDGKDLHLHGLTSHGEPDFKVDGTFHLDGEWVRVRMGGQVERLLVDDRILALLPEDARKRVRTMHLRGVYDFHFDTEFDRRVPEGARREFSYRFHSIAARESGLDLGLRVSQVALDGELSGRGVVGHSHELEGKATIHSARFNRFHFRDARVHFAYGKVHPAVEAAREGKLLEGTTYVMRPKFIERLQPEFVDRSFQILLDPADLYGGVVRGFFYAELGDLREMRGHVIATDTNITEAARSIFEKEDIQSTGTGSGEVRFSGQTGQAGSLVGVGVIDVSGSNFGDIPVFSKTLEVVAPGSKQKVGLNSLHAEFSIRKGRFETIEKGVLVRGPAFNLRGQGSMDFFGVLDVSFVPELLDFKFPLVDLFKKNLAHVKVEGTLEKPSARLVLLRVVPLPLK